MGLDHGLWIRKKSSKSPEDFMNSDAILDNWLHIRKLEDTSEWKDSPKEQRIIFNS